MGGGGWSTTRPRRRRSPCRPPGGLVPAPAGRDMVLLSSGQLPLRPAPVTASQPPELPGRVVHGTARHGTTRDDMTRYDTARQGSIRHGSARDRAMQSITTRNVRNTHRGLSLNAMPSYKNTGGSMTGGVDSGIGCRRCRAGSEGEEGHRRRLLRTSHRQMCRHLCARPGDPPSGRAHRSGQCYTRSRQKRH